MRIDTGNLPPSNSPGPGPKPSPMGKKNQGVYRNLARPDGEGKSRNNASQGMSAPGRSPIPGADAQRLAKTACASARGASAGMTPSSDCVALTPTPLAMRWRSLENCQVAISQKYGRPHGSRFPCLAVKRNDEPADQVDSSAASLLERPGGEQRGGIDR
jgi:hypothetical protein